MSAYRAMLVCFLLSTFTIGGCGGDSSEDAAVSGEPGAKTFTIGMSQCNLGEPWRVQMNADIKAAAEQHSNLKVVFKDAQNDTLKQPAIGEWVVERLSGKGKVVELKGLMTSTPGQDRHSGFREAQAGSGIEVVFEADMHWLEPKARKEMESALARYDDIDLVYAHNDPGAHGAYLAARSADRADGMIFVGIDALPHEGVAYVEQDILDATFQYPTGGAEAIDVALNILHGEDVPKRITLGSKLFTKENAAAGGETLP